ncbi:MAG: hypothetical protein AAFN93_28400 [Bacteroidota bacterium]
MKAQNEKGLSKFDVLKQKLETIQESDSGVLSGGFTSVDSTFELYLNTTNRTSCDNNRGCGNSHNIGSCDNAIGQCSGSDNGSCKTQLY